MKYRILIVISVIINILPLAADEINAKELVAVFPLKAEGVSDSEASVFTNHITAQIHESGKFRVIDRSEQEKLLNELKFSLSGCVDESCQLEAGKMLSANKIITGSLGIFGEDYLVSLKFIEVETGETINTVSEYYHDMEDILRESKKLVENLIEGTASSDTNAAPERKYGSPKIGYFSLSAGYGEIFRETENGLAVAVMSPPATSDVYGPSPSQTYDTFSCSQLVQGIPVCLGYEYSLLQELSAGIWISYIFGSVYPEFIMPDWDVSAVLYHYDNAFALIDEITLPAISFLTAGFSFTYRMFNDSFGIKFDIGYNFSNIMMIKAGISFYGIFLKGSLGFSVDNVWTTSYDYGGIWSVEGGYEFKI